MTALTPTDSSAHEQDLGVAVVFPGQGSQSLGMAGKVLDVCPKSAERFSAASEILGYDLLKLIEEGPLDELDNTSFSQPAIYTASIAWWDALNEQWGQRGRVLNPVAMAGHSLGQITALVAADALDFDHGLRLVQQRGLVMDRADQERPGGMASIIGLRDRVLAKLVGEASVEGTIVVANANGPGHTVVSGEESALRRVMHLAESKGARRVIRLPISIASHSPLMDDAQAQFADIVSTMPWRDPKIPIIGNTSAGMLENRGAIVDELNYALLRPVNWTESVKCMVQSGAGLFVEAGPGDVLTKLVRRIAKTAWTFPVSDDETGLAVRDYPDMSDGIPK
jgi:[acyl-carrier-protein] S-malonyltransferase